MGVSFANNETVNRATGTGFGLGLQFLAFAEFLLLGVWLGSMMFFSFAVAPSAFAVLPSRHFAGLIVGNTLVKVEVIGLAIGVLLLLLQILKIRTPVATSKLNYLFLSVMLATTAALYFWISPKMNALRLAMGNEIDNVPVTDPLRIQFNDLHQYSVSLMGTTILAGLVLLFFTVRGWLQGINRTVEK
jgi:hypothetical protein